MWNIMIYQYIYFHVHRYEVFNVHYDLEYVIIILEAYIMIWTLVISDYI